MLSVHGVFENGKITLKQPASGSIPSSSNVIITFTDSNIKPTISSNSRASSDFSADTDTAVEKGDDYYESLREFKRVPASGNITIIDGDDRFNFPLFDYSQGGLCFISTKGFEVGQNISSGITDPSNPDMVLMELEMEVRGVFKSDDGFKIGCMFLDPVDEDLWHGLLQYLS